MKRLTRVAVAGAAASALLAAALSLAPAVAQDGPQHGGAITILAPTEPNLLVGITNNSAGGVGSRITEGLLKIDFDGQPIPSLAESWTISDDGLEYTFNLREGVKWHDGEDFTSADVAYSILTAKEVHPRRRITFDNVTDVLTPDDHTAVIVLSQPAPYLLGALHGDGTPIVPEHIYAGTNVSENPANLAPIGTGPFVFTEWVRGSHVIVDRNPEYWDADKPYLDRIITRFIPDTSARIAAFENGEIDYGGATPIPLAEVSVLENNPNIEVLTGGFEASATQSQIFFNLETEVLQDVRVRRALAHALDVQTLIDTVWYGYAIPSPTIVSPLLSQFHNPDIAHHAFDPALSEQLLDEAGAVRGENGIRFALRVVYNPFSQANLRVAEYVRSAYAQIGVDARIQSYDFPTYVQRVFTDRDFDLDIQNLSNGYDPTDGIQRGYWSENIQIGLPFSNGSFYSNPEVDALFEAAAVEVDPDVRRAQYFEIQEIINEDLPAINLVSTSTLTIVNKRLRDHTVDAQGQRGDFASAYIVE